MKTYRSFNDGKGDNVKHQSISWWSFIKLINIFLLYSFSFWWIKLISLPLSYGLSWLVLDESVELTTLSESIVAVFVNESADDDDDDDIEGDKDSVIWLLLWLEDSSTVIVLGVVLMKWFVLLSSDILVELLLPFILLTSPECLNTDFIISVT